MTSSPLIAASILALGSTLALGSSASAAITVYTSQAAFDAAVGSETTFGFNEGGAPPYYQVVANPYTQSGVNFADNVTAADVVNGGQPVLFLIGSQATPTYGQDFLSFQNTDVGISADITAAGVTALGFAYGTYVLPGAAVVTVNGTTPTPISPTSVLSFIGFTSSTPITDINVDFPGGYSFDLTSVSYGQALATPEPATWALMILGFGMAGGALRRRGRAPAA